MRLTLILCGAVVGLSVTACGSSQAHVRQAHRHVPAYAGNQARNVAQLGTYARQREPQLHFCYREYGLRVNPELAGKVTVAVTLQPSGQVTGVQIADRSWSGKGVDAVESCIRSQIQHWQFPKSDAGEGTYPLSFVFTK